MSSLFSTAAGLSTGAARQCTLHQHKAGKGRQCRLQAFQGHGGLGLRAKAPESAPAADQRVVRHVQPVGGQQEAVTVD